MELLYIGDYKYMIYPNSLNFREYAKVKDKPIYSKTFSFQIILLFSIAQIKKQI